MTEIYFGGNPRGPSIPKIVKKGRYLGVKYKIVSYGSHPCSYLQLNRSHKCFRSERNNITLGVHGGVTFKGPMPYGNWTGWDYGHYGDAHVFPGLEEIAPSLGQGKRWTYDELIADVYDAIEQLVKL